jgi:hypothetical protein
MATRMAITAMVIPTVMTGKPRDSTGAGAGTLIRISVNQDFNTDVELSIVIKDFYFDKKQEIESRGFSKH